MVHYIDRENRGIAAWRLSSYDNRLTGAGFVERYHRGGAEKAALDAASLSTNTTLTNDDRVMRL